MFTNGQYLISYPLQWLVLVTAVGCWLACSRRSFSWVSGQSTIKWHLVQRILFCVNRPQLKWVHSGYCNGSFSTHCMSMSLKIYIIMQDNSEGVKWIICKTEWKKQICLIHDTHLTYTDNNVGLIKSCLNEDPLNAHSWLKKKTNLLQIRLKP